MKLVKSALLIAASTLVLSACGESESVKELREVVATFDTDIAACGSKKEVELIDCVNNAVVSSGEKWTKVVTEAAADDPELVAEITMEFSALSTKASEMISTAM